MEASGRPAHGHDNDWLLTQNAKPGSHFTLPKVFCLEPGFYGGVETQLASNGSTTYAAVNDLPATVCEAGTHCPASVAAAIKAVEMATGEMVAVNQDTGKIDWDTKLPYGAATVTNDVVFTSTFHGDLFALNAATSAVLLKTPLSADAKAPVAVDGDYVIAGAGVPFRRHSSQ